jgi:hypothetical protein
MNRGWFFKGIGNEFWTVSGHWMRKIKQIIRVNQLSESKVYAHGYVNKSIIAQIKVFGLYGVCSIFSNGIS